MADSARLVRGPTGRVVRPMVLDQVGGWLGLLVARSDTVLMALIEEWGRPSEN